MEHDISYVLNYNINILFCGGLNKYTYIWPLIFYLNYDELIDNAEVYCYYNIVFYLGQYLLSVVFLSIIIFED